MRLTTSHLRPRSGFTMLELLLSMAMIVVLMTSLYTAFHIAYKAQASCKAAVSTIRETSLAMQIIAHDFENAIEPVNWVTSETSTTTTDSSGTTTTPGTTSGTIVGLSGSEIVDTGMVSETGLVIGAFRGVHQSGQYGDADTVEFYCMDEDQPTLDLSVGDAENYIPPYSYPLNGGGVVKVTFEVREDYGPTPVLVRSIIRNPLFPIDGYITDDEILCRDIYSFSLRYFDGITWLDTWDSTYTNYSIPLSIMIILEIADPDAGANSPPTYQITRIIPLTCSSLLLSGYNPETGEMEEVIDESTEIEGY